MTRFHLIGVTPDLDRALAIGRGSGWLLPSFDGPLDKMLAPTLQILFTRMVAVFDLVHWAPLPPVLPMDAAQVYCVGLASGTLRERHVEAIPLSTLMSTPAAHTPQARALATSLARLRMPIEPFDSAAQVSAALAWAERETRTTMRVQQLSTQPYRCARDDYVVRFRTVNGTAYFKGGVDRVDEAMLTQILATLSPRQFPETLAIDRTQHRWLYRALPGERMLGPLLTVESAAAAARALAALQKRAIATPAIQERLASLHLTAVELFRRTDRIVRHAWPSERPIEREGSLLTVWQTSREAIVEACRRMDALDLPLTLVLSDFWTGNVLVTAHGLGFIDVGNTYWSHPVLPLWRLTRQVERHLCTGGAARASIEGAFVDEWRDVIPADDMNRALVHLPLVGQLFGILMASCDLDRYERSIGADLPDGFRANRLAHRVRSLLALFASTEPVPRRAEPDAPAESPRT